MDFPRITHSVCKYINQSQGELTVLCRGIQKIRGKKQQNQISHDANQGKEALNKRLCLSFLLLKSEQKYNPIVMKFSVIPFEQCVLFFSKFNYRKFTITKDFWSKL